MKTTKNLNNLPLETIEEVRSILKAYDECNIIYECGKYKVRTGHCLQSSYSQDYRFVATFNKNDIYTAEGQELNYIEEFKSYPYPMTLKIDNTVKWVAIRKYEDNEITFEEFKEMINYK
jgi:hypothetical protein